ncbi:Os11g0483301 [Oryza sativa Japonica Group]|uniref:Os11g0483301 protein n=1 Tax=Oryza sativa subsp. japonica TaxID=39947 RepID=A0A0P0Y2C7_ORYSJ|nr:Os11g0483301 [Oryza sativa Japonica Group]
MRGGHPREETARDPPTIATVSHATGGLLDSAIAVRSHCRGFVRAAATASSRRSTPPSPSPARGVLPMSHWCGRRCRCLLPRSLPPPPPVGAAANLLFLPRASLLLPDPPCP